MVQEQSESTHPKFTVHTPFQLRVKRTTPGKEIQGPVHRKQTVFSPSVQHRLAQLPNKELSSSTTLSSGFLINMWVIRAGVPGQSWEPVKRGERGNTRES